MIILASNVEKNILQSRYTPQVFLVGGALIKLEVHKLKQKKCQHTRVMS